MPRLLMLTSALAMMCPIVGQAQSAPISHSGARLSASTNSLAQQIGWRGCDSGRPNAQCVGVQERRGSDGVCGDTAAGGRLSLRRLSRRSDPRGLEPTALAVVFSSRR